MLRLCMSLTSIGLLMASSGSPSCSPCKNELSGPSKSGSQASSSSSARFPRPALLARPVLTLLPTLRRDDDCRFDRDDVGRGVTGEYCCKEDCDDLLEGNHISALLFA